MRYGPGVLPTDTNPLAIALAQLAGGFEHGRDRAIAGEERGRAHGREDVADARATDAFDEQEYEHGFRRGEVPISPALQSIYNSMGGFQGSGAAGDPVRASRAAIPDVGLTHSTSAPSAQAASAGIDANGLAAALRDRTMTLRPPREPMPGAFDGTGFSGITRPRFEQVKDGLYVDNTATPRAEAARDRSAQTRAAADYRRGDIRARGDEAADLERARQGGREDLERLKQQGREKVRDKIDAAGVNAIVLKEKERAARGGTAATEGQRETNAMKVAAGIIAANDGDYNAATDWLTNTEEGQSAANAPGVKLERRHLYAALGTYEKSLTDRAVSLQTGVMGAQPGVAAGNVKRTRTAVSTGDAPRMTPKGATPPPPPSDAEARAAWASANPPQPNETREQYQARYQSSKKAKR